MDIQDRTQEYQQVNKWKLTIEPELTSPFHTPDKNMFAFRYVFVCVHLPSSSVMLIQNHIAYSG